MPKLVKAKTATVETRGGGSYSYSYADLSTINDILLPRLGGYGLSFSCKPTYKWFLPEDAPEGFEPILAFVLEYTLRHTNGDYDGGDWPLPDPTKTTPQQIGGAITYARRYVLCSVTGLAADEDDDAQSAQDTRASARRQPVRGRTQPANGQAAQAQQRDWIAEAQQLFDAGNYDEMRALGNDCFAMGEFVGATKSKFIDLVNQANQKQAGSQEKEPANEGAANSPANG
jgi:hypothetical protein